MHMVPDPDNRMDELLKAYAKKRREQAGEPLGLHPATRNLLQGEAAKLAPKESRAAGPWQDWLKIFWPRVAFALSLFVILALGTWTIFRTEKGRMELSKLEVKQKSVPRSTEQGRSVEFSDSLGRAPTQTNAVVSQLAEGFKDGGQKTDGRGVTTRRVELAQQSEKDDTSKKQLEGLAKDRTEANVELMRRYDLARNEKPALAAAPPERSGVVTLKEELARKTPAIVAEPAPLKLAKETEVAGLSPESRLQGGGVATTKPVTTAESAGPVRRGATGDARESPGLGGFGGGVRSGGRPIDDRALAFGPSSDAKQFGIGGDGSQPTAALQLHYPVKGAALGEQAKTDGLGSLSRDRNLDNYGLFNDRDLIQGGASPTTLYALNGAAAVTQWGEPAARYRMTNQIASASTEYSYFAMPDAQRQRKDVATDKLEAQLGQRVATLRELDVKATGEEKRESASAILHSFDIEQLGGRIRIVEADGSVYDVRFMAAIADDTSVSRPQMRQRYAVELADVEARKRAAPSPSIQNFSFEAVGTSRSLNQSVMITGIWTVTPGDEQKLNRVSGASATPSPKLSLSANGIAPALSLGTSLASPTGGGTGPAGAMTAEGSVAPAERIRGKARIGTNEISINAVRVTP
jgi:hypothetical protein